MYRFFLVMICSLFFTGNLFSNDIEELIQKNIQARGGAEKIDSVFSYQISGKIIYEVGDDMDFSIYLIYPDQFRIEIEIENELSILAFDGENPWAIIPPYNIPQGLPKNGIDELYDRLVRPFIDFDNILIAFKNYGYKLQLSGNEMLDETEHFVILCSKENETEAKVYINSENYLISMFSEIKKIREQEVKVEVFLEDYQKTDGVLKAHTIRVNSDDHQNMLLNIDNIQINLEMDTKIFKRPMN